MKVTREKRIKKFLKFYKFNFGFREPYQVLIDNTFISAALNVSNILNYSSLFSIECPILS